MVYRWAFLVVLQPLIISRDSDAMMKIFFMDGCDWYTDKLYQYDLYYIGRFIELNSILKVFYG
jgi:hypothetical protein